MYDLRNTNYESSQLFLVNFMNWVDLKDFPIRLVGSVLSIFQYRL